MDLREIYEALEKVENGATLIAGIKAAINKPNNEAKALRTKYEGLLTAVGLEDGEDVVTQAQGFKKSLEDLKATGKKPDEIASLMKSMQKQMDDMQKSYDAEKGKRIGQTKLNTALAALQEGGAVDAKSLSKLILDNLLVKDDDSVIFKGDDGAELSVKDGVTAFLKSNPWAVKNSGKPGAGTQRPTGGKKSFTQDELARMTPAEINKNWDAICAQQENGGN